MKRWIFRDLLTHKWVQYAKKHEREKQKDAMLLTKNYKKLGRVKRHHAGVKRHRGCHFRDRCYSAPKKVSCLNTIEVKFLLFCKIILTKHNNTKHAFSNVKCHPLYSNILGYVLYRICRCKTWLIDSGNPLYGRVLTNLSTT